MLESFTYTSPVTIGSCVPECPHLLTPLQSAVRSVLFISLFFLLFLKALSDIQIAVKMVKDNEDSDENPLDRQYRALRCGMQPLDSGCHEYQVCIHRLQLEQCKGTKFW